MKLKDYQILKKEILNILIENNVKVSFYLSSGVQSENGNFVVNPP
jgi:hypothetical protein